MSKYSIHFLDTSAIVKLLLYPDIPEVGSEVLSNYRKNNIMFYTNSLCIGECLNVLKRKYFIKKHKKLSFDGYLMRLDLIRNMLDHKTLKVVDVDLTDRSILDEAYKIIKKYKIDFVDALQLLLIQKDKTYANSQKLLITADKNLFKAATDIGVNVWNCVSQSVPN